MDYNVKLVSEEEASRIFNKYGLGPVFFFIGTQTMANAKWQGMICDYRDIEGYKIRYACDIRDMDGSLVERFNIK